MKPSEILRQALAAVEEVKLPDDLRVIGFERAIDLLCLQVGLSQSSAPLSVASTGAQVDSENAVGAAGATTLLKLTDVARGLGIQIGHIDRIFHEHDGDLQFVADLEKLGKTKAAKVLGVATLYMAARQEGKYDPGATADADLRKELERHGILDTGNYSKHVAPLKSLYNINGTGRSATYKIKYEGKQKAKELAKEISGSLGAG